MPSDLLQKAPPPCMALHGSLHGRAVVVLTDPHEEAIHSCPTLPCQTRFGRVFLPFLAPMSQTIGQRVEITRNNSKEK